MNHPQSLSLVGFGNRYREEGTSHTWDQEPIWAPDGTY